MTTLSIWKKKMKHRCLVLQVRQVMWYVEDMVRMIEDPEHLLIICYHPLKYPIVKCFSGADIHINSTC